MSEEKKSRRGGAREGAGRKPKGDVTLHVSMSLGLVGRMDLWRSKRGLLDSRADAVRKLVAEALDQTDENAQLRALLEKVHASMMAQDRCDVSLLDEIETALEPKAKEPANG